jgi:hypothetical protein
MASVGFEPAIPATKRLQTDALDRTTTGLVLYIQLSGDSRRNGTLACLFIYCC